MQIKTKQNKIHVKQFETQTHPPVPQSKTVLTFSSVNCCKNLGNNNDILIFLAWMNFLAHRADSMHAHTRRNDLCSNVRTLLDATCARRTTRPVAFIVPPLPHP